jgi:cytochrome c oxidase cbb3-type subunit II
MLHGIRPGQGQEMNYVTLIFLGLLATFVASWSGMVLAPQIQLGRQHPSPQMQPLGKPPVEGDAGEIYPQARLGLAEQGRQVYRQEGCYYCHSQQVTGHPADARWTQNGRFSVHRDYLFDDPAFFGVQRFGPDLANVGVRLGDLNWQLIHLYDPNAFIDRKSNKNSVMPPYRHLFEKRKIGRVPSPDALKLPDTVKIEPGYEIVPKPQARALATYLVSLKQNVNLFEAPMYAPKAAGTNATPVAPAK